MSETFSWFLSDDELQLIQEVTIQAMDNGLAGRYSDSLVKRIDHLDNWTDDLNSRVDDKGVVGGVTLSSLLSIAESEKKHLESTRSAEYGFVFDVEPSNLCQTVLMRKIWGKKRLIFPDSTVQLGQIEGIAGEGKPNDGFTLGDLKFAVQSAERMTATSQGIN